MKYGKKMSVTCPACNESRLVRPSDWNTRKSDMCKPCAIRARSGLAPQGASRKGTRIHNIWRGMRQRCGLVAGGHRHDVERYAQRGIQVCEEWARSCDAFAEWAEANGYQPHLYIDRIDFDKGYGPDNCRWVTVQDSNRNKSTTLTVEKVALIKSLLMQGAKQRVIAEMFDTTDTTVSLIKVGKVWADVMPMQG